MKLSIIIVNYNVKHFLEQCLHSVTEASKGLECEIFVVDNNSVDGSNQMVKEKFSNVILIENQTNTGFSKANNQAIRMAKGEYILLLNPDTLVESDTFVKTIEFMDAHPEAGGLGVKMIDGKGRFLPESKRGLPTPEVAFYKIFGLSKLFPASRTFGRYHLGFLDKEKVHKVDILSGAFMLMRKTVLDITGLLDEEFFMYGEDIDLSYRIIKAGYQNYYFPNTRIIHYKGESTKKSSVNYVFTFYQAMIIFAKKHFSSQNARIISLLIHLAIYLRASAAIISRFLNRIIVPLIDGIILYGGFYLIMSGWEKMIFPWGGHYPGVFIQFVVPVYVLTWIFCLYLVGGYDRPVRLIKILQGLVIGTLVILVLYSLLDESWRFSRALILFGFLWGLLGLPVMRLIMSNVLKIQSYRISSTRSKRVIVAGLHEEANRVASIVRNAIPSPAFIGLVSTDNREDNGGGYIGNLRQLNDIIGIYMIDEVIFCSKDIPAAQIIDTMSEMRDLPVDFKIAPPESLSIIGSKSISTAEDLYIINIDSISTISNKRHKFFLDIFISLIFIPLFPLAIFLVKRPFHFLINIFFVLSGLKSWVGYCDHNEMIGLKLPAIKKGILNPLDVFKNNALSVETIEKLNLLYARDYKITTDLNIIFRGFRSLGR